MKKLLSILAAVGLTATSASAVVACSISVKDGTASKTFKNIKLADGKKYTDLTPAMFNATVKNGNNIVSGATVNFDITKGSKDNEANVKATVDLAGIKFDKKTTLKVEVKSTSDVLKKHFDETFEVSVKKGTVTGKSVDAAIVDQVQNNSLNYSKSLVMAKEYGLDVDAVNNVTGLKAGNNFNLMDTNAASALGMNGHVGEANGSIYQVVDLINNVIHMFSPSTKPLSIDNSTANTIATIIKIVAPMMNSSSLDGAMKSLPGVLEVATQAFKELGGAQKTIAWLGSAAGKIFKDLLSGLDMPTHISELLKEGDKLPNPGKFAVGSISWFMEQGGNALVNMGNEIFNKYPTTDDGDNSLSKFLGQEIFTKLLNGQRIDVSKSFDYVHLGLWSIDIIDNLATVLTPIVIEMNAYQPIVGTKDKPIKDAQHLFGDGSQTNSDYFASIDKGVVAVDDKGNVTLNGKPFVLSLDTTLGDMFDDITSNDKTQYGILKLTNELFHNLGTDDNGNEINNPLLETLLDVAVDSLKFTDYNVESKGLKEGTPDGSNGIITDMSFNIKDLFNPNKQIKIGTAFTDIMGSPMNFDVFVMTHEGTFKSRLDTGLVPLLSDILTGKPYAPGTTSDGIYTPSDDATTVLTQISNIVGALDPAPTDPNNPVTTGDLWLGMRMDKNGGSSTESDPTAQMGPASMYLSNSGTVVWPLLQPIIDGLVNNIYYTDDQPNSLKTLTKGKLDLIPADWINNKVTHFNLGGTVIDLTVVRKLISIDTLGIVFKDLIVQNQVQDKDGDTDPLLVQLINNIDDYKAWAKYLGYVPAADVDKNISSGWTSADTYIEQNSLIGSILTDMYDLNEAPNKDNKSVMVSNNAIDVSQFDSNNIIGVKSGILAELLGKFVKGLNGQNISGIVNPLYADDKIWAISQRTYKGSADGKSVLSMSYDLTLDPSSAGVTDLNGNPLNEKVTYKVTFSRPDANSNFTFTSVNKL